MANERNVAEVAERQRAHWHEMIAELDAAERENRPAKWLDATRTGFDYSVYDSADERRDAQRRLRAFLQAKLDEVH